MAYVPSAPEDHGLIGWNFPPFDLVQSLALGAAGTLHLMRVRRLSSRLVTNIWVRVTVGGTSLTSGQNFAALFTSAGALLASTADQTTAWGSQGVKTMALTAPQTVTTTDAYVGLWWNGSASPTFYTATQNNAAFLNVGQSGTFNYSTADTGLTTAAPANTGVQTASGNPYWVGLS